MRAPIRNCRVYRLQKGDKRIKITLPAFDLHKWEGDASAIDNLFRPLSACQNLSVGWISARNDTVQLVENTSQGHQLMRLQVAERKIPTAYIAHELASRVDLIVGTEGRRVGRKERGDIRDDIIAKALPGTPPTYRHITVAYVPAESLMIIDTASAAAADLAIGHLRKTLGSLPAKPIEVSESTLRNLLINYLDTEGPVMGSVSMEPFAKLQSEEGDKVTLDCPMEFLSLADHLQHKMRPVRVGAGFCHEVIDGNAAGYSVMFAKIDAGPLVLRGIFSDLYEIAEDMEFDDQIDYWRWASGYQLNQITHAVNALEETEGDQ